MRYLTLLYADEAAIDALPDDAKRAIVHGHLDFRAAAAATGVLVDGAALADAAEVFRVRSADGSATDGPYLEAKEHIGGYYLLDCSSREEAVAWVRRIPDAPGQVVELRALLD